MKMVQMLVTVLLCWFAVVTLAAPASQLLPSDLNSLSSRQVLILSPEAQLQLKPALNLQESIIQPLTPIGRIQTGNDQTVLFYPSAALTSIISLAQVQPPYQQTIQELIAILSNIFSQSQGSEGDMTDTQDGENKGTLMTSSTQSSLNGESQKGDKIEFNPEAETIPTQTGQTPASTIPLPPDNKRFYTIAGAPQFFGNFDIFQHPGHPLFSLQPLEFIKARSVIDPIREISDGEKAAIQPLPASDLPLAALPLKATINQDTEKAVLENQPGVPASRFAQFLVEQRVLQPAFENKHESGTAAQEFIQLLEKKEESEKELDMKSELKEREPSVAQARPVAIAVTGSGGLAQTAPIGTAIASQDGLAQSIPSATSIAGDFVFEKKAKDSNKSNKMKAQ